MPSQRRKIIPPNTTKSRRPRVAGSAPIAAKSPAPIDAASTSAVEKSAREIGTAKAETDSAGASFKNDQQSKTRQPMKQLSAYLRKRTAVDVDAPRRTGRFGWRYVVLTGAAAAIFLIVAVAASFKPGTELDNTAWVDDATTAQVTAAASNAVQTLYSYRADSIDQDFDNARGVLTSSMLAEYNKTADTTKTAVLQVKAAVQATVTDVGVTRLQGDRAELLINMSVSTTLDGVDQRSAQGPLNVNMMRVNGKYLLSGIDEN